MQAILLLLLLLPLTTFSQNFSLTDKKPGFLINREDTLQGEIAINFDSNQILLVNEKGISNYSATNFDKILIQDIPDKIYKIGKWGNQEVFFEVLIDGMQALCFRIEKNTEVFYTIDRDRKAVRIESGKKIFSYFENHKKEMKDYAFSSNVNLETKTGLIEIFRYYNDTYL